MPRYYPDLSDTINKTTWDMRVTDSYEAIIPQYYKDNPKIKPIYTGDSEHTFTKMTIAHIVDLCVNEVPFSIVRHEDVVSIVGLLKTYTQSLKRVCEGLADSHTTVIYLKKCQRSLKILNSINDQATHVETQQHTAMKKPTDILGVLDRFSQF